MDDPFIQVYRLLTEMNYDYGMNKLLHPKLYIQTAVGVRE